MNPYIEDNRPGITDQVLLQGKDIGGAVPGLLRKCLNVIMEPGRKRTLLQGIKNRSGDKKDQSPDDRKGQYCKDYIPFIGCHFERISRIF